MATDTTETPTVYLTLANDKAAKDATAFFNNFSKGDLEASFARVARALKKANVEYGKSNGEMVAKMNTALLLSPGKLLKAELASLLGSFTTDWHNFVEVVTKLMPKEAKLWRELISRPYVAKDRVKEIIGRKLDYYQTNSWNPKTLIETPFAFFSIYYESNYGYYYSSDFELYLAPALRHIIAPHFLPDNEIKQQTLPDGAKLPDGLKILNFENSIADDVAYLSGLESCGELLKWPGGNITQAKLASVSRKIRTEGFDLDKKTERLDRVHLLTLAYALFVADIKTRKNGDDIDSLTDFGKFVCGNFGNCLISGHFTTFFPEYKGFTKGMTEFNHAADIIKTAIKMLPQSDGEWGEMTSTPQRYLFIAGPRQGAIGYFNLFSTRSRYSDGLRLASESTYTRSKLKLDDWTDLTRTFLARTFKFLCACGMVELAVDPGYDATDPMEGIRYARLTPFGRYAAGLAKEYTPKTNPDKGPTFEYDERNRIITLLDPLSPYAIYLDQVGRRIGGNRYHISADSIVRNSADIEDAERRIHTFETKICPNPTGYWQQTVTEAYQRINCKRHLDKDYILYALNPNTPGLILFIAGNAEIARHTLKAEGNHLIVEVDFDDRFRKILHKAGYIL